MINFTHKLVLIAIGLLCDLSVSAYDFEANGIYYKILSKDNKTCAVTNNNGMSGGIYSGEVVIPSSVSYQDDQYTVTSIGERAFYFAAGLTKLTIPETVASIGVEAMYLCNSLTRIDNLSITPQTCGRNVFGPLVYPVIHVYNGYRSAYKSAATWKTLDIVEDLDPTKISSLTISETEVTIEPYTGHKLSCTIVPQTATQRDLTWCSSDEDIVYVNKDGVLVGISEGTASVTAKTNDGTDISVSCMVHVTPIENKGSYNAYLSSQTTNYAVFRDGTYVKIVHFNLVNNGSNYIKVKKCIVKDVHNGYSVLGELTDEPEFGWFANNSSFEIAIMLNDDYTTSYEWHYLYKGDEYIFCSEPNDPLEVSPILSNSDKKAIGIFDLNGKHISTVGKGVNIIKYSDGSTKKIINK
jgi:hypothetical protein